MTLHPRQLRLLSASGAAAAIAGIFNAPLGGIVFAVEVIFGRVSLQTIIPVVLSSVMSTATARFFLGTNPLLVKRASGALEWIDFVLLAVVGMLSGLGTVYFLQAFRRSQILVRRALSGVRPFVRPALGGLVAGTLIAIAPDLLETTYEPVNRAIRGEGLLWMAVVTLLLKPVSAAVTIGSGGEGGTFAPAVKFGALLGLCFGTVIEFALPESQPGLYALVCAASVLAGSYYAPLTGALVLFEISGNYELLLPLMFSTMFSVFIVNKVGIHTFNPNQRSLDVEPLNQHQL
jgi:CIC family chloride channel protein